MDIRQCQKQRQGLSLRKEVATVLGIGEATVARVVAEHNGSKHEEFSPQKIQGRPKKT
ncbi:404_t:CDS:2 [Ambispora gerdemannii]|uniref:404_t:CDS:1 n=1 Tax=Ambispora gerdemannii TaxID=144530 RepID=A0A9N9DGV6_9GLOM|nr:404_t:CDS:2 [Ambispora gerdemannii]